MPNAALGLTLALAKIARRDPLPESARKAFLALPFKRRTIGRNTDLVVERELPKTSIFLEAGVLNRSKILRDGGRQIVSFHIPGDMVDLHSLIVRVADHRVSSDSTCTILQIAHDDLWRLIDAHPILGRALWFDTLVDAAIYREWTLNIGRRDGRKRIAHLLLELGYRLELAGLGRREAFALPVTQAELADATGMTPVHVSRVLSWLRGAKLVNWSNGNVAIPDWAAAADYAGFDPLYLHTEGHLIGEEMALLTG